MGEDDPVKTDVLDEIVWLKVGDVLLGLPVDAREAHLRACLLYALVHRLRGLAGVEHVVDDENPVAGKENGEQVITAKPKISSPRVKTTSPALPEPIPV